MQYNLFEQRDPEPSLSDFDLIVVSTSGGKDSQAMLSMLATRARELGILERLVAIHADLGAMEWPDTLDYARRQAEHEGVRFERCTRIGREARRDSSVYTRGEKYGDLLDYTERRGAWPSPANRWCTSEFKRGPIQRTITALAREHRTKHGAAHPVRVLECTGLRAQESPARAKREPVTQGRQSKLIDITKWLPIQDWSLEEVWREIEESGQPVHPAYAAGMSRLSCVFCIMASKKDLRIAASLNPELLERYTATEEKTGHRWREGMSLIEWLDASN